MGGVCMGTGTCGMDGGSCFPDPYSCTADFYMGMCSYTPLDSRCDDSDVCTTDRCDPPFGDPSTGCVYSPSGLCGGDGGMRAPCEDDFSLCDDGDPCTSDWCDPMGPFPDVYGCSHVTIFPCSGGDAGGPPPPP
jgi:hypothetical protein